MDGLDSAVRWPSLKQRLGLRGFVCCGASSWGHADATSAADDGEGEGSPIALNGEIHPNSLSSAPSPVATGMNLAAALAVERQQRAIDEAEATRNRCSSNGAPTPASWSPRVSLMTLLEKTEEEGNRRRMEEDGGGRDWVCCVCMERKKGAAFIACGHAFCRVCSRELWANRGCCPLCNRPILEILDIF